MMNPQLKNACARRRQCVCAEAVISTRSNIHSMIVSSIGHATSAAQDSIASAPSLVSSWNPSRSQLSVQPVLTEPQRALASQKLSQATAVGEPSQATAKIVMAIVPTIAGVRLVSRDAGGLSGTVFDCGIVFRLLFGQQKRRAR
jgi:hypothetical protein